MTRYAEGEYSSAIGVKNPCTGEHPWRSGLVQYQPVTKYRAGCIVKLPVVFKPGDRSMVFGRYARDDNAAGLNISAIGDSSLADGEKAIALGNSAKATEIMSIALGDTANASKEYSMALGVSSAASAANAIAVGRNSAAAGVDSLALGRLSVASAANAIAMGAESKLLKMRRPWVISACKRGE